MRTRVYLDILGAPPFTNMSQRMPGWQRVSPQDSLIAHGPAFFGHTDATELRKCGPNSPSMKPRVAGKMPITMFFDHHRLDR